MNQRDYHSPIADVQSAADTRQIAICQVGIRSIRHPVRISGANGEVSHTVATFSMTVALPDNVKGTHMSRFVEILETNAEPVSVGNFAALVDRMLKRLEADGGRIEMRFPYFVSKAAPISGVKSLLDYEVELVGDARKGRVATTLKVVVPVTSLCPCSKEIAAYGAHNQRSHVTITVRTGEAIAIEDLIRVAEDNASAELYGLLKRPDEKFVTERAYDNPKFVEDLVRDVATQLNGDPRVEAYVVESENFESIHNHSAYAMIQKDKSLG
jgi:GTP cyclohydrolase IB